MILLSVIVPVYNQEKSVVRTLSSIISQMTDEVELIVINDGSIDNTKKVIEEYIPSNINNIYFYNQENLGLLKTRERGTQLSKGMYIWHVDSGDIICERAINTILRNIENNECDCYFLNYIEEGTRGETINNTYTNKNDLKNFFMGKIHFSIWSKIIRKDIMLQIYKQFNGLNITLGEDVCQTFELLINFPSIHVIDCFCYKYIRDNNSMTLGINNYSIINTIKHIFQRMDEENIKLKEEFEYFAYSQLIVQYLLLRNNKNNYCDIYKTYKSLKIRKNKYIKYKNITFFFVKLKMFLPIKEDVLTNLYNKVIGVINDK